MPAIMVGRRKRNREEESVVPSRVEQPGAPLTTVRDLEQHLEDLRAALACGSRSRQEGGSGGRGLRGSEDHETRWAILIARIDSGGEMGC